MQIFAKIPEELTQIISELRRLGVLVTGEEEATLQNVNKAKVAPEGFYSTTNHPTYVHYANEWIGIDHMKMDAFIFVDIDQRTADCVVQGKLHPGDFSRRRRRGCVRVDFPERHREIGVFEFMGGEVSSERPSRTMIRRIAKKLLRIKESGKKVALVSGGHRHTISIPSIRSWTQALSTPRSSQA